MTKTDQALAGASRLGVAAPRRSILTAARTSQVVAGATPGPPGPNQVTIRVTRTGICASDLPDWAHGPAGQQAATLGHEPVGVVVEAGPGVERFATGDVVTGRIDQALADLATAHVDDVVAVPPGVEGDAAIGEPLGCIVEAVRRTPLDVADRVAIIGLGFMGLCLLDVVNLGGASEIVAIDPREDARRLAVTHGAKASFDPDGPDVADLHDSFDVVFEVSGTQPGLDLATALVKEHSTLSVVGYHRGRRTVDMQTWNWKSIDVVNGHVRDRRRLTDSIERGLALVAAGRIPYGELFTHHYPLERVDDAYTALATKPPGFVKAVVLLHNQGDDT